MMVRRRIKRSSILAVIALVALLSLGVGHAAWEQTNVIEGKVATGNLSVTFADVNIENGATGDYGATCTYNLGETGTTRTLSLIVNNAYPGYECKALFDLKNNGTVPAKLDLTTSSWNDGSKDGEIEFTGDCNPKDSLVIEPGGSVECWALAKVLDNAQQNHTYTSKVTAHFTFGTES